MWNEAQAEAAKNKWGIAGLCIQKSECVSWEPLDFGYRVVIRAPIRSFCEPAIVAKVQDRLSEFVQKPVSLGVIVECSPISAP
jgi:hypothetical protein